MRINFKNLMTKGAKNPLGFLKMIINLPKLAKLFFRLFKDSRTPFHLKMVVIAAVIYFISPIDLIPDIALPIVGLTDDLIILVLAVQYFFKKCPSELISEHINSIEQEAAKV